jgi:Asp-tRNA(Asn)/Glu-tRNA(Gln) amidotransferase A subunit family amidase
MPRPDPRGASAPPRPGDAPLHTLTLAQAVRARSAGLRARELAEAALRRVEQVEPAVHAFVHLSPEHVRRCADAADTADTATTRGPLSGIGIGVKDIVDTIALPTEIGTPLHAGRRAPRDAACIERLHAAGGYVFGKTVTTAFAFLDPGATRNPWHGGHTPGGSSSGSAAAVASAELAAAIGTQTNGSVIRPAAFCGVVGFKPSFGWLDFAGVHLFSESLDTLGTFTRSVEDAGLFAGALARQPAWSTAATSALRAPRLAYLASFPWAPMLPGADDALTAAAVRLRMAGATVTPVALPEAWRDAHRVHRTVMLYEGARALGALQAAHRARFSAPVNAALDEGHAIIEADYRAALAAREQAVAYFTEWLAPYDAVLAPPATGGAPAGLGSTGDPGCCTLWSLTGFPAIALPTGLDADGLPLGLQLATRAGEEEGLLRVAAWCEAALGWGGRIAPVGDDAGRVSG